MRKTLLIALLLGLLLAGARASFAYSVLTHEEIVDLLWKDEIQPLLLKRFPTLTEDEIKKAHAYAYGGAVIQDLGYYPFGSKQFSDLTHYVRSGDFVRELLVESQDANEYAFAMGALAHYASDIAGHPEAVNKAVAIQYPKLRAQFGSSVNYAQGKTEHIRTEFGLDAAQVAKSRYTSDQYHDFIGFEVSKPLLERVFPVVYGVEVKDVLPREDLTIGTYRYMISELIPEMTRVALRTHKNDLTREVPNFSKRKFLYRLSRSDYEKSWGKDYTRPGFGTRVLAFFIRFMPKIGPFKALAFKSPTPQTEDMYFKSVNKTVDQYRAYLEEVKTDSLQLANVDFDTGKPTVAAEYPLTDDAYAKLLAELTDRKFARMTPELRQNILSFYSDLSQPFDTKKDPADWQAVLTSLDQLKLATPVLAVSESPAQGQVPILVTAPADSPITVPVPSEVTAPADSHAKVQAPLVVATPMAIVGKHFDRVLVIVLENQNYSSAMSNPFFARLAQTGASFSNFKALMHPSYPNYLAMVAGSSFGVRSDNQVTLPDDNSHRTIADLLDWRDYAEDYPSSPAPFLGDRGRYSRKHVPFLSFAKIQKDGYDNVVSVQSNDPHNRFVSDVEDFARDPQKYPLPRYMFYSPNMDDDGHNPVLFPGTGLRKSSAWLNKFLNGSSLVDEMKGTLVIVTFDESEIFNDSERIYTVFLGDMVKPGEITKAYNHYSILRTIEDNFGLSPLNSGDRDASAITDIWK